jgi:L-alanine-DL-glutamate epimerase-like enolase superfamily enzyme
MGLVSDLQIASAFPDTGLVEYLTGSPFIDEIACGGWRLDSEGMLPIPDKPGLGIAIDLAALAEYSHADVSDLTSVCAG